MPKKLPTIPITEIAPTFKRIAWWFENAGIRIIKRILNATGDFFRNIISFSLEDWIEDLEQGLIVIIKPYVDYLHTIPGIPSFLIKIIDEAYSGKHQIGLAVLALAVGFAFSALHSGISEPLSMIVRAGVNRQLRPTLLDIVTATELLQRKLISPDEYDSLLKYHGLDDKSIGLLKLLIRPTTDDSSLTVGLWRNKATKAYISGELDNRGYDAKQKELWYEQRDIIPSPSDLVSMATREAFNDAAAQAFGYDENFPTEAAEWAEKSGLSIDWFKRYWRAHWNLPGLVQVREMFHREIIDEDAVRQYLLAADIPSFWRDAIVEWMYKEITRVDLRRMYDKGIISIDDVYTAYLKQGYSPEDAERMTVWTGIEYAEETRELTKSDILGMYQDGILNDKETIELLTVLGYKLENISLLMAREDLKQHEKYEKAIISNIQKLYVGGLINRTDVFAEMGKLATPGHFIQQSLAVWDLEKKLKEKRPTITQLRDMVLSQTITIDVFRSELDAMGYSKVYIEWYVYHWALEG